MSIIERAMGGKPDAGESNDEDATSTRLDAEQSKEERAATAEMISADAATTVASTMAVADARVTSPQVSDGALKDATKPAGNNSFSTEVPSIASMRAATEPSARLQAELDFNDIAANGFIDPTSGVTKLTEEYQQIKRRVIGNTVDGLYQGPAAANLVMVTSSVPNEGKTFTSINLALSIAMEVDRTVLVVDTDIIKSDLTKFFGLMSRPGLYDVLGHPEIDVGEVICKTNVPGLSVIPAGTNMRGVTEKLASEGMQKLTRELSERYPDRIVIFDSPPILATSGARAMAGYIGQTILVVEACRTPAQTVKHAIDVMEPITLAGVVLNKSRYRAGTNSDYYGYGYGYGYGYAPENEGLGR